MYSVKTATLLIFIIFSFVACVATDDTSEGEVVYERLLSYSAPTTSRYAQGMDILDGYVFQGYSDGVIDVICLSTGEICQKLGPIKDETGALNHMNDLSFRREGQSLKLIIPTNREKGLLFIYNIEYDDGSFSLVEEDSFPGPDLDATAYHASTQYFSDDNVCVQVAYERTNNDGFGDVILERFDFEILGKNSTFTRKWRTKYKKLWAMQGAAIYKGYCYLSVGVPNGDAKIYKIDINNGTVSCLVDFRDCKDTLPGEEIQGVSCYNDSLYFSTTFGFYKYLNSL